MDSYFITGATGFIGCALARRLAESGARVRCLARPNSNRERLKNFNVEFVEGDLDDMNALAKGVEGVQGVFHLAGLTREMKSGDFMRVNCGGTLNLAQICARALRRPVFVTVSSLAGAGVGVKADALSGDSQERIYDGKRRRRETDAPRPISPYGRSKFAAENNLQQLANELPITVVRPPYVFGEGDSASRQLYVMAKKRGNFVIPGWRDRHYSFVYVEDLIDVLIAAMRQGERLTTTSLTPVADPRSASPACTGKGIYFAAAPEPILFSEYGKMVGRAFGRKGARVFRVPPVGVIGAGVVGEVRKAWFNSDPAVDLNKAVEALSGPWICSAAKTEKELGVAISSDLESKFRRVALWYENQGWLN